MTTVTTMANGATIRWIDGDGVEQLCSVEGLTVTFEREFEVCWRDEALMLDDVVVTGVLEVMPGPVQVILRADVVDFLKAGNDIIIGGPQGYDWRAANQAPRSARRRR